MSLIPNLEAAEARRKLAASYKQCVDAFMQNQSAAEVSAATGIRESLVTKLASGDAGALLDAVLLQRQKGIANHER